MHPMNLEPWRVSVVGWIATICFASCYIPQLWHTYKTKKVDDISLGQWAIQLFGYFAGIGYGAALGQWPLIFGYFWGMFATTAFICMYIKYHKWGE